VYEKGVEFFLKFAKRNGAAINGRYYCSCVNCVNEKKKKLDIQLIREHVICDSFLKNNTTCTWHGEVLDLPFVSETGVLQLSWVLHWLISQR